MATLLSDKIIFTLFEVAFFFLLIYAVWKEVQHRKSGIAVIRGTESWTNFNLAFGITSVVLMQVINSAEAWVCYKTIISIANLGMLFYLVFFNGWFRNKINGIISKAKQKEEKFPFT